MLRNIPNFWLKYRLRNDL